jgi:hypothetical protein
MAFDEACRTWASSKSTHFDEEHKPVGKVDFDLGVDGYESSGYFAVLDVAVGCSCDSRIRIEASPYDFNEILEAIVNYSKENDGVCYSP